MMVVSLYRRVALHKAFLKSPCLRHCLCSMSKLLSCQRDEYDITVANFSLFLYYLSSWFLRTTIQLLALCNLMSDSRFTMRQHTEGMDLGLLLNLSCFYSWAGI